MSAPMRVLLATLALLVVLAPLAADAAAQARKMFHQNASYSITVSTDGWSNYDGDGNGGGGCVTCPYTCTKRQTGPTGASLNLSNTTLMASLPAIYSSTVKNGCCYAPKRKSKIMPDCNVEADPPTAEACGFLSGPKLLWRIAQAHKPPTKSVRAILFASVDCKNFWAVGATPVKYGPKNTSSVTGSKRIDGGCYGDAAGEAMVLAGCLTYELKFSKSTKYTWDQLAAKCAGLDGICAVTNSMWHEHLKCCTKRNGVTSVWNKEAKMYAPPKPRLTLPGVAIMGIVVGGVACILGFVHCGAKMRARARQTALMRECEASDDYAEIMTPLAKGSLQRTAAGAAAVRAMNPQNMEVSLHEGDEIFRKRVDEVLYEDDLY